ncbi:hypothetical protein Glove_37g108 [Diversispora epigaea]|uniref:Uncharacterized protein n=1 Tax=Diversispora epigaea TaxID=1348612 RepID=A0A397JGG6_9GLOM|nr:hypothetical protein Glove_37g108 [Diversispora epigaea]
MAFEFFSLATNEITDLKNISFADPPSTKKLYEINKEIGLMYLANLYLNIDEGFLIAISKVGYYYEVGFGIKKNEKNAFELYLKSADVAKGFQLCNRRKNFAMCNTGHCYDCGIGASKDLKEAFKWYLKVAEKVYSLAQYNLRSSAANELVNAQYEGGKLFYEGRQTKEDIIKTIYWLNKNGSIVAHNLLEGMIFV